MNAATPDASSPFVIDVGHVLRDGRPEQFERTGPAPLRIGAEMIGVEPGTPVTVAGVVTPLGGGVLVDADVTAPLSGTCVRCLADLADGLDVHVSVAFSAGSGFVVDEDGEDAADDESAPPIVDDLADLTQSVIDEAVLALPFNPTCENVGDGDCAESETGVPAPDGVVGEDDEPPTDPRWAALAEKFGDLRADEQRVDGPGGTEGASR